MAVRICLPDQADYLCPRKIRTEDAEGGYCIIDLSRTSFVKPFGLTLIYGLIHHLRSQGERVRVQIGRDDVARYLSRMNLYQPFATDPDVIFDPDLQTLTFDRWERSNQLLELRVVDIENDDEVIDAETHVWDVISARAPSFVALSEEIRTSVVELISNVQRHSCTSEVTVIAQTHMDCVRIAVGDVGIGIRKSLEKLGTHDLAGKPDHEVLHYATEPGVTGSAYGGGMGLATILDLVRNNGRAAHIASGHGVFSVMRRVTQVGTSPILIPGTIVEVVFDRSSG